ncbi:IS110 family transposase [Nocardia arthritidis]|uniref:IS110 family transposase n=1 Tax=Nocardia arthritidis TaxID=228602 RepID=A0A6G9YBV9_9NOCA|nr:IS110 family transposase [Nocardia arthritidis]QIS10567.1 IS110 family transposase [Nocardia arthritidis]
MTVIIGMDPHKRSATIEAIDPAGKVLRTGQYGTDTAGYTEMLTTARRLGERVWAVEGCNGVGRHLAYRLLHDGEVVVDVPAKLSAQVRVFATGNGRKTDPVDAHSVALAALRSPNLRRVQLDSDLVALGMLADRREELGRSRTDTVNRLHRLLLELLPGGAKKFLSAMQARELVATVKPRDPAGKVRRRLTVELIEDLERIDRKIKAADKELRELVTERGPGLIELKGIGPAGAARLLADVGDIHRFSDRGRFASWNGTAPIDASSGEQKRHRLSRAGNRKINRVLHTMAIVQLRNPTAGRVYYDGKKAAGKTSMEAMRALKRRLSNVVYTAMLTDQRNRETASPGGQSGATTDSCATGLTPDTGPSDKPHPGPTNTHHRPDPHTTT